MDINNDELTKNIKVTVVTVVYNGEKTIEKTILSVLQQDYENIEYLIIDGQSSDKTLDIINKYRNKISKIISEKDDGIYDAMNKALKIATGDFLIFMGADDTFYSNETIKNVVNKIQNIGMKNKVYYGQVCFTSNNKIYDGYFDINKITQNNICHQCIFYPKNIYSKVQYKKKYRVQADYEYNLKNYKSFIYIDLIVTNFNNLGISSSKSDVFWRIRYIYIFMYLGIKPFLYAVKKYIERRFNKIK